MFTGDAWILHGVVMKFTTVLANGICMSDWLERAFLHGTQCKFETMYLQSMHVALWSTSFLIWTRISQRLVRLQFDLNSTMTFSMCAFLERFSGETGDLREVECLVYNDTL